MLNKLLEIRHNYWRDYWFRFFDNNEKLVDDTTTRLELIRRIKCFTRLVYRVDNVAWASKLKDRQFFWWEYLLDRAWKRLKKGDYDEW